VRPFPPETDRPTCPSVPCDNDPPCLLRKAEKRGHSPQKRNGPTRGYEENTRSDLIKCTRASYWLCTLTGLANKDS